MWTVSTTKGVSLFSSVWELGTPLFYQCPILGVQFTPTSPPAPLPWGEGSMLHKKQKALTQTPTSPPAPLPWGEGSMLHKKQKALTQTHKKASLLQRPNASHALSQAIHSSMTQALWGSSAQIHAGMCRHLECRLEAQGSPGNIPPPQKPLANHHASSLTTS